MRSFPLLNTGAVTQYPLTTIARQGSQVICFLDGKDQRFRSAGRLFRRWHIRHNLLNEKEIQALETFFLGQLGTYTSFVFPDPYTGADVPNCRFAADGLSSEYNAVDISRSSFWVVETNG